MMNREHKIFVLSALLRAGSAPMPVATLSSALRLAFPNERPTDTDTAALLRSMEREGYIAGTNDDLLGEIWTLTARGLLRAKQL